MGQLDQLTSTAYYLPSIVLMENAGLQVGAAIREVLGNDLAGRRVTIFAGKGNNGGDGLVVARHLLNAGAEVKVFMLARPEDLRGDAETNYRVLHQMQGRIYSLLDTKELQQADVALLYTELVVDAIYGTGFKGAAMGLPAQVIELINQTRKPVIAVDLPSGLEADTGRVNGPCVRATVTVTFGLPKIGLVVEPGANFTGRLKIADISIPRLLIDSQPLQRALLTAAWCRGHLPPRSPAGHKGEYGHVFIVGGSEGLTGAVKLAGEAALRAGAGLVTIGVPTSLHPALECSTLEVMTRPLPETPTKSLAPAAAEAVLGWLQQGTVLGLGPGLGRHPDSISLVREVLPQVQVPLVVDADGLNALAGHTEIFSRVKAPLVLTPHPGEMARLTGLSTAEIQHDRLGVAERAAREWPAVVVLKGARTVVAAPDGRTFINPTGNPGLATGGTGDVLTGIIAGLLAQGLPATEAAAVGVYLHGLAGDLAARRQGQRGVIAGDLLTLLGEALQEVETSGAPSNA